MLENRPMVTQRYLQNFSGRESELQMKTLLKLGMVIGGGYWRRVYFLLGLRFLFPHIWISSWMLLPKINGIGSNVQRGLELILKHSIQEFLFPAGRKNYCKNSLLITLIWFF